MSYRSKLLGRLASLLLLLPLLAQAQGVFPLPEAAPDLRLEVSGSVNAIVPFEIEGNQFYLIGGAFDRVGAVERHNLALLDAAGQVADSAFDASWLVGTDAPVHALVIADGAVFVGGEFEAAGGTNRARLAKFALLDGALDAGFAPAANSDVRALAVDGLGHLYVGGSFDSIDGLSRSRSAKLQSADGLVVAGWVPGYNSANVVYALAYDDNATPADAADDFLYVGGNLRMESGGPENRALGRLQPATGMADQSWQAQIRAAGGATAFAIAIDADFVYAGGLLKSVVTNNSRSNLARFARADAALDPWNPSSDGALSAMALAADGNLVVAGDFNNVGGLARQRIAKLRRMADLDGSAGSAIAAFSAPADRAVAALAHDSAGQLIAGGQFNRIGAQVEGGIARLDAIDGTPDAGFAATAGSPGAVRAFAFDSLGGIVFGGSFDAVRQGSDPAIARQNVARMNPDYSLDTGFEADAFGEVLALDIAGNQLYLGGRFLSVSGNVPRSRLARFDLDPGTAAASLDLGWMAAADADVHLLDADANGIYAFGDFGLLNGSGRVRAGRFDAAGSLTAWAPNPDGLVRAIVVDGASIYLGGDFLTVGGAAHAFLARVDAVDGLADDGFVVDADGSVGALMLDAGQLYVGGGFDTLGGVAARSLARLDPAVPQVDAAWTPWAPSTTGMVQALAIDANNGQISVGGAFVEAGGRVRPNLARVSAMGSVDPSWRPGSNAEVRQLAALATGNLLLAGHFSTVTGETRVGIAQLGVGGSDVTSISIDSITPVSGDVGDASVVGQAYSVSWSLANLTDPGVTPTGSVTVSSDAGESCGPLPAGAGGCELTATSSGARGLVATFVGDAQFLDAVSAVQNHQVDAAEVVVTVSTSPNPSAVGAGGVVASISLDVQTPGAGTPQGAVQISVDGEITDGCVIVLPDTSCALAFFDAAAFGLYRIEATYEDANIPPNHVSLASAIFEHGVGSATSLSLSIDSAVDVGGSLIASVVTSGIPDGEQVEVVGGLGCSIVLASDAGSCELSFDTVGNVSVVASYTGNDPLLPASDSAMVAVAQLDTNLAVMALPAAPQVGETVTLQITTNLPDGETLALANAPGCASITLPSTSCETVFAAAGQQTVEASFAGSADYTSASDTVLIDVAQGSTSLSLTADPVVIAEGGSTSFNWTLDVLTPASGTPSGSITVSDGNGLSCSADIASGGCSIQIDAEGDYGFSAGYVGDANFAGSNSGLAMVTVVPAIGPPTDADLIVSMRVLGSAYFVADDIELVQFEVQASNMGPADVLAAPFEASIDPLAFADVTWTCAPAVACSAESGVGNPSLALDLGNGSGASILILATVSPDAPSPALGQASISVPGGLGDPELANNSTSASYQTCSFSVVQGSAPDPLVLPVHLCGFRDSFEAQP